MLALKSVVRADAAGLTLVFDEVDAGIGGRVAEVVGRKLRALADKQQVLCVTHLPQIAAFADQHLRCASRWRAGGPRRASTRSRTASASRKSRVCWGARRSRPRRALHAQEMLKQSLRR